jgi:uncharacterized protein YvpB
MENQCIQSRASTADFDHAQGDEAKAKSVLVSFIASSQFDRHHNIIKLLTGRGVSSVKQQINKKVNRIIIITNFTAKRRKRSVLIIIFRVIQVIMGFFILIISQKLP